MGAAPDLRRRDHALRLPATIGFAAGILGAILSYDRFPSIWLSIFVFAIVGYSISRLGVLTGPRKIQRALDSALLPASAAGIFYGVYLLTSRMWLAVLLGFLGGGIVRTALGRLVFPRMRGEEPGLARGRVMLRWEGQRRPRNDLGPRGLLALALAPALILLAVAAVLSLLIVAAIVAVVFVVLVGGLAVLIGWRARSVRRHQRR